LIEAGVFFYPKFYGTYCRDETELQTRALFTWLGKVGDAGERTHQDIAGVKTTVVEALPSLVHVYATKRSLLNNANVKLFSYVLKIHLKN